MRRKQFNSFGRLTAFFLAVCLLCTGCRVSNGGGGGRASSMKLVKTEGGVAVTSDKGRDVKVNRKVSLYAGYGVATETQSYAWIDLDDVKLTKLDEKSDIRIEKKGKKLELYLNAGGIFFNVTEPLEEDETLNIRTATMVVGIRGTCGWVYVQGEDALVVSLLEGTVTCTVVEEGEELASRQVTAGETATMTLTDGEAEIKVTEFTERKVPAYVREEVQEDRKLSKRVEKATGFDLSGPGTSGGVLVPTPAGPKELFEQPRREQVISAAHNDYVSAVVMGDGRLCAWGFIYGTWVSDQYYEYYDQTVVMEDVKAVSVNQLNYDFTGENRVTMAAITNDGALWLWGDSYLGVQSTPGTGGNPTDKVNPLNNVVKFSMNGDDSLGALTADGKLWVWGDVFLGDGKALDESRSTTPVAVMEDVADFSVCSSHVAAVKTDGSLWLWGDNYSGQIGVETGEELVLEPVKVMEGVRTVSVSSGFTVAVKLDGTVWAWGSNRYGQLGNGLPGHTGSLVDFTAVDGLNFDSCTPLRVEGISGAVDVYTDTMLVEVLCEDGSVWAWGETQGMTATDLTVQFKWWYEVRTVEVCSTPAKVSVSGILALDGNWFIDKDGTCLTGGQEHQNVLPDGGEDQAPEEG